MKKVIIVGAGIVGAATAYELSRKGVDVTVVDNASEGRATAAAAGIICPWLTERRNQAWYELARKGAAYYGTLIADLEGEGETDTGFKRIGLIRLLTDEARVEKLYDIAVRRRSESPEIGDIEQLDLKGTQAKFPLLNEEFFSLYISGAARVDGRKLQAALMKVARKNGAEVLHGKASLLREGNKIVGVSVAGENLLADAVVATNGVWMNELLAPLQSGVHFEMRKGQLIHLHESTIENKDVPLVMALRNQYIIPFQDGRIVIGATSERPDYFDTRFTAGSMQSILNYALETAPGLQHSTFLEVRAGFRPYTENFLPVFGKLPEYEGIFLANGLGASGLTTGPFIGKQLAQLLLAEDVNIDLEDYKIG